jgi:hypothetical protein
MDVVEKRVAIREVPHYWFGQPQFMKLNPLIVVVDRSVPGVPGASGKIRSEVGDR